MCHPSMTEFFEQCGAVAVPEPPMAVDIALS